MLRPDGELERGLREIVPEQVIIVQRVFKCFAEGLPPAAIARMLNKEGVPAPQRLGWSAMTLRGRPSHGDGILRNRHYIGELVWNRRERVVDPISGEAHRRLNPAEARIVGLVPELRVIDDHLWTAVQARLLASAAPQDQETGRQRFWEKRRPRHLLSSKVFCGACGGPFSVHRACHYRCNGVTRGLCNNRVAIKREVLEARVLAILAEQMMDPELAEAFAAEFTAEWNRLAGQHAAAEGHVRRELDAAERKLRNLLDAIAEGIRSSGLQAKLSGSEAEVERLRLSLASTKPTPVRLMPNLGHAFRRNLERLREALNAGNNPEALEAARALIERVIIHASPRGTPPGISVEGHLAQMLTAAQPELPPNAAKAIAEAAKMSVKEETRGRSPSPCLTPPCGGTRPGCRRGSVRSAVGVRRSILPCGRLR
ncbi:MAG: recombinase family protein [Rhodospirillales bacterium]|nr:recombinase family protein [Rhodospirillales bacterium]